MQCVKAKVGRGKNEHAETENLDENTRVKRKNNRKVDEVGKGTRKFFVGNTKTKKGADQNYVLGFDESEETEDE